MQKNPADALQRRGSRRACLGRGLAWAALACGVTGAGLVGCSPAPMTLGLHPWPGYALIQLAMERGWIASNQVVLAAGPDATTTLTAMRAGRLDAATLTLDETLLLRSQGVELQVAAVLDVSVGADALFARPQLRSLAELRGQRIGVEQGAVGSLMLHHILKAANLGMEDIQPVALRQDDMLDALNVGRVDAAISYEPHLSRMEALGFRRLYDSRAVPKLIMDVLAVRPGRARHDALQSLIQGHFRAREAWLQLPLDAAISLAHHLGVRSDQVPGLYRGLNLPGLEANRAMLQPGGAVERAALQLSELMVRQSGWPAMPEAQRLLHLCSDRFLPSGS